VKVIVPLLLKSTVPVWITRPDERLIVPLFVKPTAPVPVWFRYPELPVMVPELLMLPLTLMLWNVTMFSVAPELTVRLKHVAGAVSVTWFPPVVAMTTSSPIPGTEPPTQVVPVLQVPPVVVLVIVAANTRGLINKTKLAMVHTNAISLNLRPIVSIVEYLFMEFFSFFILARSTWQPL
jgi:hypothetical protein